CDRVAALSIADARDNSRAAVNANSDPQGYRQCRAKLRIERACSSEHIPTGGDGIATAHAALSVEPENGHCTVAQVRADPAAVRLSCLSDLLKEAVDQKNRVGWELLLGESCESPNVDEQDRDLAIGAPFVLFLLPIEPSPAGNRRQQNLDTQRMPRTDLAGQSDACRRRNPLQHLAFDRVRLRQCFVAGEHEYTAGRTPASTTTKRRVRNAILPAGFQKGRAGPQRYLSVTDESHGHDASHA